MTSPNSYHSPCLSPFCGEYCNFTITSVISHQCTTFLLDWEPRLLTSKTAASSKLAAYTKCSRNFAWMSEWMNEWMDKKIKQLWAGHSPKLEPPVTPLKNKAERQLGQSSHLPWLFTPSPGINPSFSNLFTQLWSSQPHQISDPERAWRPTFSYEDMGSVPKTRLWGSSIARPHEGPQIFF